jgi:hypothetical protein
MLEIEREFDENGKVISASALCRCGSLLDMLDFDSLDTIECTCGRLFNSSGQELRPRDQWEEPLEEE